MVANVANRHPGLLAVAAASVQAQSTPAADYKPPRTMWGAPALAAHRSAAPTA